MAIVPEEICAAFKLVNPEPFPLKVPAKAFAELVNVTARMSLVATRLAMPGMVGALVMLL